MNKAITILFVHYLPDDAELVLQTISADGINFIHTIVGTKNDFVEALISFVPDIIISEYTFNQFDWKNALSFRNEIAPQTPFIIVTGNAKEGTATECIKAGANDCILRSNLSRLTLVIKSSLAKRDAILFRLNAETELRISDKRQKFINSVLEEISVAVVSVDKYDIIILWNRAAEKIFGWKRKEVLGFTLSQFINNEYIVDDRNEVSNKSDRLRQWRGELYLKNKKGERIHVFCYISEVKDENGLQIGLSYEYQEYTDEYLQEKAPLATVENKPVWKKDILSEAGMYGLNKSVQITDNLMRLDLAVKSAGMGISSYDVIKKRRYFDNQACHLLGIDQSAFKGSEEEFLKIIHPGDREEIKSLLHLSIKKRTDYESEYRVIWNDGSLHYIVSRAQILTDEDKNPVRLNGLIWDVTDQKLMEINLRENLRKTNSIINNQDGVVFRFRLDEEMTVEYISQGVKAITGYPSWDFLMNRVRSFNSLIVKDDKEKVKKSIRESVEKCSPYSVEYRITSSNGEQRWLLERGHGVSAGVTVIVVEGFITEITEKKNIESKLNKSLKQLQQLNQYLQTVREKERMAISRELHDDLGQALTAVKIDLGSLKKTLSNNDEAKAKIEKITLLVSDTIKTVQNLTAQLRPQIIHDLGLEAAIEWYTKDFSERTGVNIKLDIEPLLKIPADISLIIFRIIQESLTNIARHSKATKAEIRLWIHEDFWRLSIRDNGIGIRDDDKKSKSSFGIISMNERAKCFGGELNIFSPDSGGTTVSLLLPIKKRKYHEDFDL